MYNIYIYAGVYRGPSITSILIKGWPESWVRRLPPATANQSHPLVTSPDTPCMVTPITS